MITDLTLDYYAHSRLINLMRLVWVFTLSTIAFSANGQLYNQSFTTVNQGFDNCSSCGTYNSPGYPAGNSWRLTSGGSLSGDYFKTVDIGSGNIVLEAKDLDGEFCFLSRPIPITGLSNVGFSVVLSSTGTFENDDYIDVSYSVNGGSAYTEISNWHGLGDNDHTLIAGFGGNQTVEACNLTGSSMIIRVCMSNNSDNEIYRLHQASVDTSFACILNACTDCSVVPTGGSGLCAYPGIGNNQDLLACEQFKIAFVIDESGSIVSAGAQDTVEKGTLAFLQNLVCPNVEVAVIEFGTTANTVTDYVSNDATLQANMLGYFNGTPFNGYTQNTTNTSTLTNWHDAMYQVQQLSSVPDLVLFFTDGNPTVHGIGTGIQCGSPGEIRGPELYNPMAVSNQLKSFGSHVFMLGVGTVNPTNLERMSGATQFDVNNSSHSIANTDYALEQFSTLAQCLAMFGSQLCPTTTCAAATACPAQNNGSITINTPGTFGVGTTFTYSFDGPGIDGTPDITVTNAMNPYTQTGLGAGTYSVDVLVNINASCSRPTPTCVAEITSISCSASNPVSSTCNGSANGSFDLSVAGGTPSYSYVVSNGVDPNVSGNLATNGTVNIPNLNPGVYGITVTETGPSACSSVCQVTIPNAMNGPILSCVNGEINCFGDDNGTVSVNASGGSGSYSYAWNTTPSQTTPMAIGLSVGSYTVTVTDALGCKETCTAQVTGPSAALTTNCTSNHPFDKLDCFGETDGRVNANAAGGTPGYTYIWNNGSTNASIIGLGSGTYRVTVTDSKGCTSSCSKTLTEPPLLTVNCVTNHVNDKLDCFGETDGSVTATAAGGTTGYSYLWNTNATTSTITGLGVGTYIVTVTDSKGCKATCSKTLTQPLALTAACVTNHPNDRLDCFGETDGSVTVTAGGGSPGYTYLWNTNATTATISMLGASTYSVTITDSKGCTATCSKILTQPTALTLNCTSNHPNDRLDCFGDTDGRVNANAGGGTPGYSYLWNNGATTASIIGLSSGIYRVTVTDSKGCMATCSKTLTQPTIVTATCVTNHVNDQLDCFGDSDGSVTAIAGGGTPGYTFLWSTGATTNNITGLGAGTYTATITDTKGCMAMCSKTLTQPSLITASCATNHLNDRLDCFGDLDGSVSVTPGGGSPGYTYLWNNGATTSTITGLGVGMYVITVTDTKGCKATCSKTLTQPTTLTATCMTNLPNDKLDCFGDQDGSVTVTAGGGTASYSYLWSNAATSQSITGLGVGTYMVTVTDSKGCTVTCSKTITQPLVVTATCATNHTNDRLDCNGDMDGSITVTGGGGTPGYTYIWNTSATTASITGLGIGTYRVTITDVNGCTASCTKSLTQPTLVTASCMTNHPGDKLDCFGDMDGSVIVTGGGGTPGYTYLWSNAATTASITGLAIGTYRVTVTDSKGCIATCSKTLTEPLPLAATCATNHLNDKLDCNGDMDGSITATSTGGTPGYTYLWSTNATTATITGLGIGNYQVTVTDAKGCTATCSKILTEPTVVTATCVSNHVNDKLDCNGDMDGSVTVTPGGGTPGYTYLWNTNATTASITGLGVGTYTVTVTDTKGCKAICTKTLTQPTLVAANCVTNHLNDRLDCNGDMDGSVSVTASNGTPGYTYLWSTNATTTSITGLGVDTYRVTVTDSKGCTATCSKTLTQPTLLSASCATNHLNDRLDCNGDIDGSVTVTPGGGTPGYTYLWSTSATTTSITGLGAGTYVVTVTDSKGCTTTCSKTLTQPTLLTASCATNHLNDRLDCNGDMDGSMTVTPGGGTPGYTYLWSTNATTASITGLGFGTYLVTVTDAKGCMATCSKTLTEPTLLSVNCMTNHVDDNLDCFGDMDGSVTVTAANGTPGYTYLWSNGATTTTITGLGIGTYGVTVTDLKGCTKTCSKTLTQPTIVTANCVTNHPNNRLDCFGDMDGSVTVTAGGGTSGYTYLWNNGATTTSITGLGIGTYNVTVTDMKGCKAICSKTITQPPVMTAICATNHSNDQLDCFGDTDGSVTATPGGGTPGYTYLWNTNATTATITGLGQGSYLVTITDANGCTATCSKTLTHPPALTSTCVTNHPNDRLGCFEDMDGSVTVTATGGNLAYSYLWNNGATTNSITGLGAGTYTVTVTDAKGCTTTCSRTLTQPMLLTVSCATNHLNDRLDCNGDMDGRVTATPSGGTAIYTYLWNTNATTAAITGLGSGTYQVTVTDANGCKAVCSKTLSQPPLISATCSTNHMNDRLDCFGDVDGSVTVVRGGGTPGFTFLWNNGSTTTSITGLGSGLYSVTVTDAKGCSASCSKTLSQPSQLTATCASNHPNNRLDCFGDTDGVVTVNVGGGTAGYSYLWSNGAATSSITGLGAGTYQVTVTDSKGCIATCSRTITQPNLLACNIAGTDVQCNTIGTGAADASVSGGTLPYVYLWNNGATTQDISSLSAGNYTLSVTDAKNCMTSCNVFIDGLRCSTTQTECATDNLRGAVSSAMGGTPPYTYLWSTGETTASIDGLIPGLYSLVVTDAQDCETECQVLVERCETCDIDCGTTFARLDGFQHCFDEYGFTQWGWSNGLLGQGNYTFDLYSEALLCDLNNGELVGQLVVNYSNDIVVVTYNMTGNHIMTLTNLYVGCTDVPTVNGNQTVSPSQYPYQQVHDNATTYTYTIDVSQFPCEGIYVIAHAETCLPSDFGCEITGTSVDCNGSNTGTASATVTGGTPPYFYRWSTGATTDNISGLVEGYYSLSVTDESSCMSVCEVLITYPAFTTPQIGPFCRNDAPYDLSTLITDPNLMGSWSGPGVSNEIFYPSSLNVGVYDIYYLDPITCASSKLTITVNAICCPPDYSEANGRKLIGIQEDIIHYQTDGILDSEQQIEANTIYDSKLQIVLKPTFEVLLGYEFSAVIDGCP